MKQLFITIIFSIVVLQSYCQYNYLGTASQELNSFNNFLITPDQASVSGAFWYQNPINLNENFELVASIFLGCDTVSSSGGDGIAFVIQNGGNTQAHSPNGGGELGYGGIGSQNGINPSLAIQFDTYQDNPIDYPMINDPNYDHVGLMKNGSIEHNTADDLTTVPFNISQMDVEDCNIYNNQQITIKWNAQDTILKLFYCNGIETVQTLIDLKYDIKNEIFSGNELSYIGFTGSTGSATNLQKVAITYFDKEPIMIDETICSNQLLEYDLSYLENYSFEWLDDNDNLISNLPVFSVDTNVLSSFKLILTNNCTGNSYTENFSINPIIAELEEDLNLHQDINCFNQSNGQFALSYSNNEIGTTYQLNNVNQTSPLFSNLESGNYEVVVNDQSGCSDTILIEILDLSTPIQINQNIDNQINICINGGKKPYQISYNNNNITNIDSCVVIQECEGEFNLIIQDSELCTDSTTILIESSQGYIDQSNSEMILNQSYQPVSYTWYLNNELIETEIDSIFSTGLCPGTYRCVVKNSIGCNKTFNISIDPILANLNDKIDCSDNDFNSIKSNASGGTEPYLYLWNTGETNQEINNINPQKYTVQITDNNNCVMIDEITVPTLNDSCLYNTFSPNGDNINDQWIVNSSFLQQDSKLSIFNRWGKKIYKSETSPHIFEGLSNTGKKLSEGTYFYIIESENIDPIKGTITLYR